MDEIKTKKSNGNMSNGKNEAYNSEEKLVLSKLEELNKLSGDWLE